MKGWKESTMWCWVCEDEVDPKSEYGVHGSCLDELEAEERAARMGEREYELLQGRLLSESMREAGVIRR